jgi:hypothetical protein
LAEASRLVLTYAGQEFDDIRLSDDEFPMYKDCEFGRRDEVVGKGKVCLFKRKKACFYG